MDRQCVVDLGLNHDIDSEILVHDKEHIVDMFGWEVTDWSRLSALKFSETLRVCE